MKIAIAILQGEVQCTELSFDSHLYSCVLYDGKGETHLNSEMGPYTRSTSHTRKSVCIGKASVKRLKNQPKVIAGRSTPKSSR